VNKQQLVLALAVRLGKPKADMLRAVDALFGAEGVIGSELRRGRKVQISGFGSFEPRKRKARTGRNPRTGRAMAIKAAIAPVFRAGSGLKQTVNKK